jgi:hypothetical protein
MSYRDELRGYYNNTSQITRSTEQWMTILESGGLDHRMVMHLVRERDELRDHITEQWGHQNIEIKRLMKVERDLVDEIESLRKDLTAFKEGRFLA